MFRNFLDFHEKSIEIPTSLGLVGERFMWYISEMPAKDTVKNHLGWPANLSGFALPTPSLANLSGWPT